MHDVLGEVHKEFEMKLGVGYWRKWCPRFACCGRSRGRAGGSKADQSSDVNTFSAATRCVFRLRPAGWAQSSRATQAISGLALPAPPANAARVELAFTVGRSLCLSCTAARAGVVADVATALGLPRPNVRVVEVRDGRRRARVARLRDDRADRPLHRLQEVAAHHHELHDRVVLGSSTSSRV